LLYENFAKDTTFPSNSNDCHAKKDTGAEHFDMNDYKNKNGEEKSPPSYLKE